MASRKFLLIFLLISAALFINGCARVPKPLPSQALGAPPVSGGGFYHAVERGETLYRISKSYGVDASELMRVNHIYNPSRLEVGQKLFIPGFAAPAEGAAPYYYAPLSLERVREIVGPKNLSSHWETITVHHSGTLNGGARAFDRDHRRRRMGGLFYHFVIGNGSNTAEGAIEVGWRWKKQVKANRPNDIQICLVGNFDKQQVSEGQLDSLANLINVLREQYDIPLNSIRRHCDIPGKHTDCPGRNFPFERLLSKVTVTGYRS